MLFSRPSLVATSTLALGARAAWPQDADLNSFITAERAIALQGALNNIGPNGSEVAGASAGLVVASPSKANPNYFYTWSRDSALTLKMINDEYVFGNADLQVYLEDYLHAQAALQTVSNPSGTLLPSGTGLGEPKYNVDGTRFTGDWGRPQRDGPALRAITLIDYSWTLVSAGKQSYVAEVIWPIIANDLSYVGQYWNSTGFDLWEEVNGSSFFTTQNQYRSLVEGASIAAELGVECTACDQAPDVLCFLQAFWNGEYYTANINLANNQRNGVDANTMLGPISVFDSAAACDSPTLQPCHSKSLSTFKVFVDAFRNTTLYPINAGIDNTSGIALGRYPTDVYDGTTANTGGNPWYLITVGAAEFLYDAVAGWAEASSITVDATSLPFFLDIFPGAEETTYTPANTSSSYNSTSPFIQILTAATLYADSFVSVAQAYTPENGSLSEQFSRVLPGNPLSAYDLTWSFAAFVTMAQRRAGQYPRSWIAAAPAAPPATCAAPAARAGTYAPALAAGARCKSTVRFAVNATTYYGESVVVVGNTTDLGAWSTAGAPALGAATYDAAWPLWTADLALAAGETVSYAYARLQDCDQGYVLEDVNRTLVVPACVDDGASADVLLATDDAWDGPVGTSGGC